MRYWWVNQNQTFDEEVSGGFLWSPKTRADGARNQFYENMKEVEPGDVIFSFCDARIKAIGVAVGRAETAPKPDFGNVGGYWSNEGWHVPVEYRVLKNAPRPKDHIDDIRPFLPDKYSPLQATGDGNQGVYLAAVPDALGQVLISIVGKEFDTITGSIEVESDEAIDRKEKAEEAKLKGRTDIGETQKAQLIQARRGQGIFRTNVRLNESKCRVTGVEDPAYLIASHIKPWRDCSDEEKLSGFNGLLLAPHIDLLFDKGLISFSNSGDLIVSSKLDRNVLDRWRIPELLNVGRFSDQQEKFLQYHRENVLRK